MASPDSVTIENLSGTWVLDKTLSTEPDSAFALQGINWFMRKTIGLATITTKIKQFPRTDPRTAAQTIEIAISQSTGIASTQESRYLDWSENLGEDRMFGKTITQAQFIAGSQQSFSNGKVRPDFELRTKIDNVNIGKFLRGEVGEDLKPCEGFLVEAAQKQYPGVNKDAGLWIYVVMRSQESKWLSEQVWGFELIDNKRHYVRRIVVSDNKGKFHVGRIVYSFKDYNDN